MIHLAVRTTNNIPRTTFLPSSQDGEVIHPSVSFTTNSYMKAAAAAVTMIAANTGKIEDPRFFLFGTHFLNLGIPYKHSMMTIPINRPIMRLDVVGVRSAPPAAMTPNPFTSSVTMATEMAGNRMTPVV